MINPEDYRQMNSHHPQQYNFEVLDGVSEIFRNRMIKLMILPRNANKAKRAQKWLSQMGARMKPRPHWTGSGKRPFISNWQPDTENFLHFEIKCKEGEIRYRYRSMAIEIPWEIADKVLALGFLP